MFNIELVCTRKLSYISIENKSVLITMFNIQFDKIDEMKKINNEFIFHEMFKYYMYNCMKM